MPSPPASGQGLPGRVRSIPERPTSALRTSNEECLCFGWIDSRPAKIDQTRTALLCTPRKPGSGWSKVNKDRIDRLLSAVRWTDLPRGGHFLEWEEPELIADDLAAFRDELSRSTE